jgi:hypothetical protein
MREWAFAAGASNGVIACDSTSAPMAGEGPMEHWTTDPVAGATVKAIPKRARVDIVDPLADESFLWIESHGGPNDTHPRAWPGRSSCTTSASNRPSRRDSPEYRPINTPNECRARR